VVLLLDNYDSFTYMLRDYILQCGKTCMVIRNNEKTISQIQQLNFSSIVISPGPKTPAQAGITMQLIQNFHLQKPILGVCLGHQALGTFFGMQLQKATLPMHGKTSKIKVDTNHFLFANIPETQTVMRYHSLILQEQNANDIHVIARTSSGEIMAIAHKSLPLAGVQFHPESVLTTHGITMIQNWFSGIQTYHITP